MINELAKQIHQNAKAKGFWDKPRNTGEMLMLIVSEIAEALEADRKDKIANINAFDDSMTNWKHDTSQYNLAFQGNFQSYIKDTFADELADAAIRIFDLAFSKNIDLEKHIELKMKYNSMREHMHGKKY